VIQALISDFGGVLTTPLVESFASMQGDSGVDLQAVGLAMARIAQEDGRNPLFELETGRMTERDFLARLGRELSEDLGREVELHGFGERYFAHLDPNAELIAYLRDLRERGLRLALLTNNVREWEPLWRPKLPVDELFETVVDSGFVGMRKPDPEIYELTLERLDLPAEACLFLDDIDVNVQTAESLGMRGVHFRDTAQAIAEIEAALDAVGLA
jgi:putative hydrolase of the HAD superfamily